MREQELLVRQLLKEGQGLFLEPWSLLENQRFASLLVGAEHHHADTR